jgi:ubiquinone/menaquinone biosynthesis C-methylase UbiE
MVIKQIDVHKPKAILEIGAADCRLAKYVAGKYPHIAVTAVDHSEKLLNSLPPGRESRVVGSADKLPFEDSQFDFIYMVSTIKHVYRVGDALAEIKRVLVPDGILLIIEPTPLVIKTGAKLGKFDLANMPNLWSVKQTEDNLIKADFSVADSGYFDFSQQSSGINSFLINLFYLVRLKRLTLYQYVLARKSPESSS